MERRPLGRPGRHKNRATNRARKPAFEAVPFNLRRIRETDKELRFFARHIVPPASERNGRDFCGNSETNSYFLARVEARHDVSAECHPKDVGDREMFRLAYPFSLLHFIGGIVP